MSAEDEKKPKPGPRVPGRQSRPTRGHESIVAGPAARARAEGRSYNVQLSWNMMTLPANEDGSLRSKLPQPYLPILQPCDLCPGRCCRVNVKVSLIDAVRYCSTLGLPFFAGLTLVPSAHASHAFRIERDPRFNPEPEGWSGSAEIQLRRRLDGSCHALTNIGGYDRCSVYAARPSICRIYPINWTSDVAKGGSPVIHCPVPYGVTEGEERKFIRDIEESIEGWEHHDDIVIEWHASTKPEERKTQAFLEFAIPRACAIAGVKSDHILEHDTPERRMFGMMIAARVLKPRSR